MGRLDKSAETPVRGNATQRVEHERDDHLKIQMFSANQQQDKSSVEEHSAKADTRECSPKKSANLDESSPKKSAPVGRQITLETIKLAK